MNYSKDTFIEGLEVKANEPIFREVEAILIDKLGYDIEMLKDIFWLWKILHFATEEKYL